MVTPAGLSESETAELSSLGCATCSVLDFVCDDRCDYSATLSQVAGVTID